MCFPITGLAVDIEGEATGAANRGESGDSVLSAFVTPVHSNNLNLRNMWIEIRDKPFWMVWRNRYLSLKSATEKPDIF